jgi:hypothetical protein
MESETLPSMASADRLREVLRRSHMLRNGPVSGCCRQLARDYPVAHYAVALDLCGGLPVRPSTPHSQHLASRADRQPKLGRRHSIRMWPLRCRLNLCQLLAERKADTRAWHLLLEDLTDSQLIATAWPLPPNVGNARRSSAQGRAFTPSGGTTLDSRSSRITGFARCGRSRYRCGSPMLCAANVSKGRGPPLQKF